MSYQDSLSLGSANSQGTYDRARGGVIEINLTIPSRQLTAQGACGGTITTKQMKAKITIDVEQLPVINVAGYLIEEEQIAPAVMPHPGPLVINNTFS